MHNMLIAILKYTQPLAKVDELVAAHLEYLQALFDERKLLICGRMDPRTGGVIIANNLSRNEFEQILSNDPFKAISDHTIIEFTPNLYDKCLQKMMDE